MRRTQSQPHFQPQHLPWPIGGLGSSCALLLACLSLAASGARAQATFHVLPGAAGGGAETIQTDLSSDGSVVAFGQASDNKVGFAAVPVFGAVQLADCPGGAGDTSNARGLSGDGTIAVGVSVCFEGGAFEAIRTLSLSGVPDPDPSSQTNFQSFAVARMGDLPGGAVDSRASAASSDGSAIVGWSSSATGGLLGGGDEAFYWTNPDPVGDPTGLGQMTGLGFLGSAGDTSSRAFDISADGLIVVGKSRNGSLRAEAVVWTLNPDGSPQSAFGLGDLQAPSGTIGISSTALAVSADGNAVVGEARAAPGSAALEAFLYSRTSGQMLRLGGPTGEHIVSRALAVSADGSVVVGSMQGAGGSEAFIWTDGTGMRSLRALALTQGVVDTVAGAPVDLSQWALIEASGVSADGLTISGYGRRTGSTVNEAWVLRLTSVPEPGTALLGAALLAGMSGFGRRERLRRARHPTRRAAATALLGALFLSTASPAATTLRALPVAIGGGDEAISTDLSADGSVVAFGGAGDNKIGFVWTPTWGSIQLQDCPQGGDTSNARGISGDGSVAVGVSVCFVAGAFEAVRTVSLDVPDSDPTSQTGLLSFGVERMGDLPGGAVDSRASAVSFDGSAIVGWSGSGAGSLFGGRDEAFRWTHPDPVGDPKGVGEMLGLGFLPGDNMSRAHDVSADGRSIVGLSRSIPDAPPSSFPRATLWRVDAAGSVLSVQALGDIAGSAPGDEIGTAWSVSWDGSVVVGEARTTIGSTALQAFRWTATDGITGLGDLPGGPLQSRALGVSADGQRVVGSARTDAGETAFLWTPATGMLDLRRILADESLVDADSGAPIDLDSWRFVEASSISDDGLSIGGYGFGPLGVSQAWVIGALALPAPATDCIEGAEADGDGLCAIADSCPDVYDPGQSDVDGDGRGDACDACPLDNPDDSDGDGVCDSADRCPGGADGVDFDADGVPDFCDTCPLDNPDDSDGDGVCDSAEVCNDGLDNDGDGHVDYPADPECTGPSDDSEAEPPATPCGLLCASLGGEDRLRTRGVGRSIGAFSLALDLDGGSWSAADAAGNAFAGTYSEGGRGGRKIELTFDAESLAVLMGIVEARASAAAGTIASVSLRRPPKIRLKLNRVGTRVRLRGKLLLNVHSDGSTRRGIYRLSLSGLLDGAS